MTATTPHQQGMPPSVPAALGRRIAALGPIAQLAFVPEDFDAALAFWTGTMGAGPFYLMEHIQADQTRYLGRETQLDFSVAMGYWGDMQIELIRQHCTTASIYTRHLPRDRNGLHHVMIAVDDMDAALAVCRQAGGELLQEASFRGGAARIAYLQMGGEAGLMVELWQGDAGGKAFFARIRDAARDWDGQQPLRRPG